MNSAWVKRFWAKVEKAEGCWLWTGALTGPGYGKMSVGGKFIDAHRLSYRLHKGEIPQGLELDHLCKTKSCVNPEHLEAVTHKENLRRAEIIWPKPKPKTFCKRGHAFDVRNTHFTKNGVQQCRECGRIRAIGYRKRRRNGDESE